MDTLQLRNRYSNGDAKIFNDVHESNYLPGCPEDHQVQRTLTVGGRRYLLNPKTGKHDDIGPANR